MRKSCLAVVLLTAVSGCARASDARLDEAFRDFARPGAPGASVIVIRQGKAVVKEAYGLANVKEKVPATRPVSWIMLPPWGRSLRGRTRSETAT